VLEFSIQKIVSDGEKFLCELLQEMQDLGISLSQIPSAVIDHLCFRVASDQEYQFYKQKFSDHGILLIETPVGGRPISTFRLLHPIVVGAHSIDLLELPAPKLTSPYSLGFEHAEIVIRTSFEKLQSSFPRLSFKVAGGRNLNAELCLKTKKGGIKFHYLPLDRVIEIEQAMENPGQLSDIIFDFSGTIAPTQGLTPPLYEEVIQLMHQLVARGQRVHLWTSLDSYSCQKKLERHGLAQVFTTVSCLQGRSTKPSPDSLQFDWTKAPPHSVMMIGDSPSDMGGAKNIRAIAAAALWDEYASERSLIAAGAELYFYRVAELAHWLKIN
jgi:predicted metalloenzyme YecM/FMN phosphatase YigB (HAD superfamily)